jgi:hypothetical protein
MAMRPPIRLGIRDAGRVGCIHRERAQLAAGSGKVGKVLTVLLILGCS